MIEITNGSICYESLQLFRHLNLRVKEGTLSCITGPSGCGKSSLLHAILGIVPLSEGTIQIGGKELNEENVFMLRHRIAWLPQELSLPCEWVSEMVRLPFTLKASRKKVFHEKEFSKLMNELCLEANLYRKRINEISGGQRQRLMIASAALLKRDILLIDEPTSALDKDCVTCVLNVLRRLADQGSTILTVSHDQAFIKGCDQVFQLPLVEQEGCFTLKQHTEE